MGWSDETAARWRQSLVMARSGRDVHLIIPAADVEAALAHIDELETALDDAADEEQ